MKTTIEDNDIVFSGTFLLSEIHEMTALLRARPKLILGQEQSQVFELHRGRNDENTVDVIRHGFTERSVAKLVRTRKWKLVPCYGPAQSIIRNKPLTVKQQLIK